MNEVKNCIYGIIPSIQNTNVLAGGYLFWAGRIEFGKMRRMWVINLLQTPEKFKKGNTTDVSKPFLFSQRILVCSLRLTRQAQSDLQTHINISHIGVQGQST